MVYRLPVEIFHEIMGDLENAKDRKTDFQILNSTAFNTNYLGFNNTSAVFNKREVRLAFNFAIDRKKLRISQFKVKVIQLIMVLCLMLKHLKKMDMILKA